MKNEINYCIAFERGTDFVCRLDRGYAFRTKEDSGLYRFKNLDGVEEIVTGRFKNDYFVNDHGIVIMVDGDRYASEDEMPDREKLKPRSLKLHKALSTNKIYEWVCDYSKVIDGKNYTAQLFAFGKNAGGVICEYPVKNKGYRQVYSFGMWHGNHLTLDDGRIITI